MRPMCGAPQWLDFASLYQETQDVTSDRYVVPLAKGKALIWTEALACQVRSIPYKESEANLIGPSSA